MANNVTEVFRVSVPSVGLVLKARADIDGKQDAFVRRIKEDAGDGEAEILTEYSANMDCVFNFNGGEDAGDIRYSAGDAPVKAMPVFFETRYFFRGDFKSVVGRTVKDVRVEHRMASVADAFNYDDGTLVGTLDFINEPGRFRLDLRVLFDDDSERTVRLEFWVVSVKMNVARDYTEIVRTIDEEKPNIVRAFLSKTFWGAALNRDGEQNDKDWYDILVDVFDYYENACKRVVNNPHRRYIATDDWRRADRIKRWTAQLANCFNRMSDDRRAQERFRTERLVAECDTPENRFVLYSLKELRRKLEAFGEKLNRMERVSQAWKDGVADRAIKLKRLASHPFFRGVSNFEGFRQQSLVLQKSAGYAQILTAWLKLKSALKPGGEDIDVSYRPISTLYEFWCYLKMRDFLKGRFGDPISEEWGDSAASELLDVPELTDSYTGDGQLCKIDAKFKDGERFYLLSYQKTYSAKEVEDGETMAGLNPQRPDIVLSISEGDAVYTYLFDAKYRIWTKNDGGIEIDASPRAAIDDMHRYRDAILYRLRRAEIRHEIIGAYVLYPGRPAPHLCAAYDESILKENIGAIPLLPGHLEQLEKRLSDILNKTSPENHLSADIPTRGTTVFVGDEVGAVRNHIAVAEGSIGGLSGWVYTTGYFPLPTNFCGTPESIKVLIIPFTGNAKLFRVKQLCTTKGSISKEEVETLYNKEHKADRFDTPYSPTSKSSSYIGYKENDKNGFWVWEVEITK